MYRGGIGITESEAGVSPVVGVMLMLSVTVIIAAIVSAAAGGLSGTEKTAPSAILAVHFYENRSYSGSTPHNAMTIEHISGSPLQTKDLSISTYYRNKSSQLIKGALSGEKSIEIESGEYAGKYSGVLYINDQDRFGDLPFIDSDSGYQSWFGNASAVLMAGDILVTPAQYLGTDSSENRALNTILNLGDSAAFHGYKAGDIINVKIVHIPSGRMLFDKDVVVV